MKQAVVDYLLRNVTIKIFKYLYTKYKIIASHLFVCFQEADMTGSLSALSLDRSRKGDFTAPVFTGQFLLVEPMPAIENRFFAPIKPFKPLVICLLFFFTNKIGVDC